MEGMKIARLILRVQHADDQEQGPCKALFLLGERFGDHQAGSGVVAAVNPDLGTVRGLGHERALGQALHPPGPFDTLHRRVRGAVVDAKSRRPDRRDRRGRIGELVPSGQSGRRDVHEAAVVLVDQPAVFLIGEIVLAIDDQRRFQALGGVGDDVAHGIVFLRAENDRDPRLDDASLLGRYQLDAIAEIGFVVERDRHDQRHDRPRDDVGRVETAAEPDLDDRQLCRVLRKQHEHDRRQDLEDRDRLTAIGLRDAKDCIGEHGVVDELASAGRAEPVALVPADQMRRGVDVHGMAAGLEQRPRERGGRPLAVRPGDVQHRRHAILRIAEARQQPSDPIQRKVETLRVQRHQALDFTFCGTECRHEGPAGWAR